MSKLKNTPFQKLIFLGTLCIGIICWVGCGIQKDTRDIAHNTKSIETINQKIDSIVEALQVLEGVAFSLKNIASHLQSIEQDLDPIKNIANHLQELHNIAITLKNIQCQIDGLPLQDWIEKMIETLDSPLFSTSGIFATDPTDQDNVENTNANPLTSEASEAPEDHENPENPQTDTSSPNEEENISTEPSLAFNTGDADIECIEITRGP